MIWIWYLYCLALASANIAFDVHYENAVAALDENDYIRAMTHLTKAYSINPHHIEVNKVLGALYFMEENYKVSEMHFAQAVTRSEWKDAEIVANYIESMRLSEDEAVVRQCERALPLHETEYVVIYACAKALADYGAYDGAVELFVRALSMKNDVIDIWKRLGDVLLASERYEDVERVMKQGILQFPNTSDLLLPLALSFHYRNLLQEALDVYQLALTLNPTSHSLLANTGAVYQSLGRTEEALHYYNIVLPHLQDDAGFLNNYGALLMLVGRDEEAVVYLKRAIEIDLTLENPLTNLASYYQDEGMLDVAKQYFMTAQQMSLHARHIAIRVALFLSPVVASWEQMLAERWDVIENLQALIRQGAAEGKYLQPLDATLDRIHFYLCYSGLNDRYIQDLVAEVYRLNIKNISAVSRHATEMHSNAHRRVRVGFISKFFGVFEPHGLLLDGVMRYLPRDEFEVYALPIARTDGKALSPSISEYADFVMEVSLSHGHAIEAISNLKLDILVFADTLSEPMTHFLAFNRFATTQLAFWGNPITSGSPHIDYFVSADVMEHPYRTRIPDSDVPYTEQVVLIEGQGIWYYAPKSEEVRKVERMFNLSGEPVEYRRSEFGFDDNWFIFFCPQSVFKMHPLFDSVLYDILDSNNNIHIVLTAGRKKSWTEVYINRLTLALGKHVNRCHMIERVSSQLFLGLLRIADALLHPFPFDGSRTSADSLAMGIPMITMPTEYLRGRMGAAFLRNMNIPELVARNRSEYVRIAYELSMNPSLYVTVTEKIKQRSHLIWEDMEVPYSWMQLLSTVSGKVPLSWEEYIRKSRRDVAHETMLRDQRQSNREEFNRVWGDESWLLADGVAHLDAIIPMGQLIRPFIDWKSGEPHVRAAEKNIKITDALQQMADFALRGDMNAAYDVGVAAYQSFGDNALLLLDLGALEYFRGNHKEALEICEHAARIHHKKNKIIEACIGVAALYLGIEDKAILALMYAWEQQDLESDLQSRIFALTKEAMDVNLLMALSTFHRYNQWERFDILYMSRYEECVRVGEKVLQLPRLIDGGAYVLLFSFVDWGSGRHEMALRNLEAALTQHGIRFSLTNSSLLSEIERLQRDLSNIVGVVCDCFMSSQAESPTLQHVVDMLLDILDIDNSLHSKADFALITQFYQSDVSKSVIEDVSDMQLALLRNLANPHIKELHLLTEQNLDFSALHNAHKIHQVVIGRRLTFKAAFEYANAHLTNMSVILANADIYFDESLSRISVSHRQVHALLKWKDTYEANTMSMNFTDAVTLRLRVDSQDAWIFKPPLSKAVLDHVDFVMGLPRCDNRLAAVFRNNGYEVRNPALIVRAVEYHTRKRSGDIYNTKDSVSGEGSNVLLSSEP